MDVMIQPLPIAEVDRTETGSDFEEFFRTVYDDLARALLLLTGEAAEAEDIAQEALARAYERWDRVSRMESPAGYVFRTAMNLNRKRLRRIAVRARRWLPSGVARDPIGAAEDRTEVLRILRSLPSSQREALVLVEWLELDVNEAAAVLRIAPSSVRGRVFRARAAIRERFGDDDG